MSEDLYEVCIARTAIGFKTIEVKAKSKEEAESKAIKLASNEEFTTKDAHYDAEHIEKLI